ncbi:MAG TPA: TIGR03943 family protein [Caldilineaceae bacterium]|nr:TIGR03943 family protein [Caldilineaceae bacterium]
MNHPRIQALVKALLLIGVGFFLYGRIANGTLYYYINERFAGFTLFGVIGLLAVGLAYQFGRHTETGEGHEHHVHSDHSHQSHGHALSWGGALLVALPIVLGLAVPPRPLGVSALDNREMSLSLEQSALPAAVQAAAAKAAAERTILDWWRAFQTTTDYSTLAGQEAKVVGFVYRNPERYGEDHFLLTRFVVSCCVADAAVVGLVVRWPETAMLQDDQWVEVSGVFAPSQLEGWEAPVLAAKTVTPVATPTQPYLYP